MVISPLTILLVEDEPHRREEYESNLAAAGHTVVTAAHATEAERIARKRGTEFDVVLSDTYLLDPERRALDEGYNVWDRLSQEGLFRDDVCLIGMSSKPDVEEMWVERTPYFILKQERFDYAAAVAKAYVDFSSSNGGEAFSETG